MRCPNCNAWATPDMASCDKCGNSLETAPTQESVLDKYRSRIHSDQKRWRNEIRESAAASDFRLSDPSPEFDIGAGGLTDEPSKTNQITLEADSLGILNFLLLHAGYSPLGRTVVRTKSPNGLAGTRIEVTAKPAVFNQITVPLADLGSGGDIEPPVATPDHAAFFALDEAVRGAIEITVRSANTPLAVHTLPVTVQNANEWIATEGVEAALAGMVTPNAPPVVEMASQLPGDFVAYQDESPDNLATEVGALYEGIRRRQLSYIGVPPSFEGTGQKVLFPDEVLANQRGCCIDIAVLTAALLEKVGYNPLLVMITGHALSGVWTSNISSKTPIIRDPDLVRQAVADGDLLVWNSTTYFDRQGDDSITSAIAAGQKSLDQLQYVIDVAACREHGLKPVPRRSV